MTEKIKIDIVIDGRNFTVVGTESEEYVRNLAFYVDKKIRELSSKNDKLCQTMSATLAALNIADELHKNKVKLEELENEAKEPLEQYGNVVTKLEKAELLIDELNTELNKYKEDLKRERQVNSNMERELKNNSQIIEMKEKELSENQRMIKSLQDKIFDNQMELIETKKELEEVTRILNEENLFSKEEI